MRNLTLVFSSLLLLVVGAVAQSLPTATLTSSSPFTGAGLGTSVALTGSTIAAGGGAVVSGRVQGVVYVFTKPPTAAWTDMTEAAQLISGSSSGGVGGSVGISGDASIIVSIGPGGVDVFMKPAKGWQGVISPVATLAQGAPPKPWIIPGDLTSVAINSKGDTIVAGAYDAGTQGHMSGGKEVAGVPQQGAAYVWVEPTGGWADANEMTQTAKFTAGVAYDHFGWAVGVSANTVVVGAPANAGANTASNDGAAYLFQRPSAGIWHDSSKFNSKFTASDAMANDVFGYSVAVGNSGSLVAVGSNRGCGSSPGVGYVFARPASWWQLAMTQTAELTPSDTSAGCFGLSVTVGSQVITIGAPSAMSQAGAAYTFAKPSNGWANLSLPASMLGGTGSVGFGSSESVNGPSTAVGAPYAAVNGSNGAGAVYVFSN